MTWGDVFMIIIVSVIAVTVLISTVIDVIENVLEIRVVRQRMLALTQGFSLYTNTTKLFATNTDTANPNLMSCLNGIRAISISWVVIGHTLFEMCGTGLLVGRTTWIIY